MTSPTDSQPLSRANLIWLSNKPEIAPFIEMHQSPDGWLQAPGSYPRLVIRIYSAIYSRVPIDLKCAQPAEAKIASSRASLCHPGVDPETSALDPDARKFLADAVLTAVRRTGFRMCLVFGAQDALFIEKDGSMNPSNDPPSGGLQAKLQHPESLSNLSTDNSEPGAQQHGRL
jgi:hypothetical protein